MKNKGVWGSQREQRHRDSNELCLSGAHRIVKKEVQIRKKMEETLTLGIKTIKESSQACFGGPSNQPFLQ